MGGAWRMILWRQFGASIDMLDNAVRACPEGLWGERSRRHAPAVRRVPRPW